MSKKKLAQEVVVAPAQTPVALETSALAAWLDTVQCTAPFTIADAKALQQMIKQAVPDALVEVYWTGGESIPTKPLAMGVLTKSGDTIIVRIGDLERNIFVV